MVSECRQFVLYVVPGYSQNVGKKKAEFHGLEDTIYAAAMPMVEFEPLLGEQDCDNFR
jgi:hypothetical protein